MSKYTVLVTVGDAAMDRVRVEVAADTRRVGSAARAEPTAARQTKEERAADRRTAAAVGTNAMMKGEGGREDTREKQSEEVKTLPTMMDRGQGTRGSGQVNWSASGDGVESLDHLKMGSTARAGFLRSGRPRIKGAPLARAIVAAKNQSKKT